MTTPQNSMEERFDVAYIRGDLEIDPCPSNKVPLKALKSFIQKEITTALAKERERVAEWAKSTAEATGVDMRNRRWIDLDDLLKFLTIKNKIEEN